MAVKTEIIGSGRAVTSLVQCCGDVSAEVIGVGVADCRLLGGVGDVGAERQKDGNVCVSLVFNPSNYAYLRVHPNETMWIDVGAGFDYDVFSNTDWMVN